MVLIGHIHSNRDDKRWGVLKNSYVRPSVLSRVSRADLAAIMRACIMQGRKSATSVHPRAFPAPYLTHHERSISPCHVEFLDAPSATEGCRPTASSFGDAYCKRHGQEHSQDKQECGKAISCAWQWSDHAVRTVWSACQYIQAKLLTQCSSPPGANRDGLTTLDTRVEHAKIVWRTPNPLKNPVLRSA